MRIMRRGEGWAAGGEDEMVLLGPQGIEGRQRPPGAAGVKVIERAEIDLQWSQINKL